MSGATISPSVIIVMGVSGAGKTRLGRALATALGWEFADADDYHPPVNVAKMRAGVPLTDEDRAPWLATLRAEIGQRHRTGRPLVLACSALKESYRRILVGEDGASVGLLHLDGSPDLIAARLAARTGHYMPPTLLASQLAALEPATSAVRIDIALTTEEQVAVARAAFQL